MVSLIKLDARLWLCLFKLGETYGGVIPGDTPLWSRWLFGCLLISENTYICLEQQHNMKLCSFLICVLLCLNQSSTNNMAARTMWSFHDVGERMCCCVFLLWHLQITDEILMEYPGPKLILMIYQGFEPIDRCLPTRFLRSSTKFRAGSYKVPTRFLRSSYEVPSRCDINSN